MAIPKASTSGQGSHNAPRFIILDYAPPRERTKPPVVVVGKGITFDSGGISLKPSLGMEMMKYDMSGAAAVLGTLEACARLKLPQRVVGLIPSAENMPAGGAYKPGDVIKTYLGKTVEVNNTDAEGRLVLVDALAYAAKLKPRFVVDLATLTGACLVVIGPEAMLAMGNDDGLIQKIRKAGDAVGERVWPLPLWDEYLKIMKSDIAELKNAGGRDAGSITVATVNGRRVHLDGGCPVLRVLPKGGGRTIPAPRAASRCTLRPNPNQYRDREGAAPTPISTATVREPARP